MKFKRVTFQNRAVEQYFLMVLVFFYHFLFKIKFWLFIVHKLYIERISYRQH